MPKELRDDLLRAVKQGEKVSKKNDRVATKLGAPACAS
jgi:hypothetical protein